MYGVYNDNYGHYILYIYIFVYIFTSYIIYSESEELQMSENVVYNKELLFQWMHKLFNVVDTQLVLIPH